MKSVYREKVPRLPKRKVGAILEAFASNPGQTLEEIGRKFKVNECTVKNYIRRYWLYSKPGEKYVIIRLPSRV